MTFFIQKVTIPGNSLGKNIKLYKMKIFKNYVVGGIYDYKKDF